MSRGAGRKQFVEPEIETFEINVTPDDERRIGRLAIESRLLREDVIVWMLENNSKRQEEAPMWRDSTLAFNALRDAINTLLGLEDDRVGIGQARRRRRG